MRRILDFIFHAFRYLYNWTFFNYGHLGKRVAFDKDVRITHPKHVYIGDDVKLQTGAWIYSFKSSQDPVVTIGENTDLGRWSYISATNSVIIGKNVLIASNSFISDHNHEYRNYQIPIMNQGITKPL